jgi:predicted ATPase
MLKSLTLKNFTVFREADLHFGKNLNVIVGENGTGKTHILKAAYAGIATVASSGSKPLGTKSQLQIALADKLIGVFRPDALGRLVRRAPGRLKCELKYSFDRSQLNLQYSFSRLAWMEVSASLVPSEAISKRPVYLPTRELLSIFPGFVSLYETTQLSFEETWRDTCILLGAPLARGPRESKIKALLGPLEESLGGKIELDRSDRFYLNSESSGRMEMHLVAEGLRKLATIARLIATGALLDTGYLFWDEPEANLNPKVVKTVAKTILQVAKNGIQIFVATHSLFLLRELHILLQQPEFKSLDTRCFGLHLQPDGSVTVDQGRTMDEIGDITSLDEDLQQSDRYLSIEMGLQPVGNQ